jgi:hypothetical protein
MGILNKHTNSQASINNQTSQSPNGITSSPVSFLAGRVKSIILDENSEGFNEFGEGNPGWNGLGLIQFQDITNPTTKISPAKPFFPNNKNFPLIEEIVWIIQLPSTNINGTSNNPGISTTVENYYLNPTALWNHPHHNGFPANPSAPLESQKRDYLQTSIGNVRRVTDQSTELNLGKTFTERSNIHPLKPFEGDVIYEGRWGNSIRIGSTIKLKKPLDTPLNNWSTGTSTSGDPILIIRNGQGTQTKEGWIPVVEDINNDEASIYFTSTQKIPLKASSTSYNSYNTTPTTPDQYTGKQIILNSGRLVFNTTEDHLLFSSKKSVNLNAQESVNIDSKLNTVVSSPSIKLGSKDATEPILKGDALVTELQNLINQLIKLTTTLVAVPQASTAASLVLSELPKISARIALTKSKVNKII